MSDNWRTHAKYWSNHYEVHAIDQRNHGKSFHSQDFDYDLMAVDIVAYMDYHNIQQAIVLGHSMGGKTAMSLALQYPTRVSKLIVADIAPKNYNVETKFSNIIKGLLQLNDLTLTSRADADKALMPFVPEMGVRQFLLKNLTWTEERTLKLRCNISVLQHKLKQIGVTPTGTPYTGDVLFLAGQQSDYVLQTDMAAIHALFPNASLYWVADAGHWLHAENPKGFTDALQDFLC